MTTESTETPERRCISSESISLGSIRSIPITLHYSFFLLLIVELFISLRYTMYPMYIAFILILYGPILLFTVIVHELGHALTTKKMGGQVEGITLWPLGGFAVCGPTESGLSGDLKVAFMGPAMHIPMGLIWWGVWVGLSAGDKGLWPSWVISLPAISSSAVG
jgi:Zn-dependent protease